MPSWVKETGGDVSEVGGRGQASEHAGSAGADTPRRAPSPLGDGRNGWLKSVRQEGENGSISEIPDKTSEPTKESSFQAHVRGSWDMTMKGAEVMKKNRLIILLPMALAALVSLWLLPLRP